MKHNYDTTQVVDIALSLLDYARGVSSFETAGRKSLVGGEVIADKIVQARALLDKFRADEGLVARLELSKLDERFAKVEPAVKRLLGKMYGQSPQTPSP